MVQRHMPIGYKMVKGKIQLDESKVNTVKKIFQDYALGATLLEIARGLTDAGFLNANNEPKWYHGTVSMILDNVKYQGDGFYPQIIDAELFEKVKKRRNERCEKLGRHLQYNSASRQTVFSGILRCGECGDIYKKYVEHSGKSTERTCWKCKQYINRNQVCCTNSFFTDEQIKMAFVSAANRILSRRQCLDQTHKKQAVTSNFEYEKLNKKIKELETDGQYSSKELPALIFERAQVFYKTARIDDNSHNMEKVKEAFRSKQFLIEFDEELFQTVIHQVTVQRNKKLTFEFINGLSIEITL